METPEIDFRGPQQKGLYPSIISIHKWGGCLKSDTFQFILNYRKKRKMCLCIIWETQHDKVIQCETKCLFPCNKWCHFISIIKKKFHPFASVLLCILIMSNVRVNGVKIALVHIMKTASLRRTSVDWYQGTNIWNKNTEQSMLGRDVTT